MEKTKNQSVRVLFLLLGVFPTLAGLLYTLLYSIGGTGLLSRGLTTEHWVKLCGDPGFWAALALSVTIAGSVSLLSGLFSIALVLWWKDRLDQAWVTSLLTLPLLFPPMVAAFIGYQWLSNSGMLARIGVRLGWILQQSDFPVIVNAPNQVGIIITLLLLQLPIFLLLSWQHFKSAHLDLYLAQAGSLGASRRQQIFWIAAPILWLRIRPSVLIYGIFLFGAFEIPLLLGQQYPAMLSVFLHQKFSRYDLQEIPVAYAGTFFYALLVMTGTFLFFWKNKNNIQRQA